MVGGGTLEVAVYLYFYVYSPISISPSSPPLLVSPSLEEIKPELSSATSAAERAEVLFVTLTGVTIPYRRNIGGLLSRHTDLLYWQFHTPTYTVTRAHLFPYVEAMEEYQSQFIWGTAREIRIGWIRPPTSLNKTRRELGWGCVCVPSPPLGLLMPGLVAAGGWGGALWLKSTFCKAGCCTRTYTRSSPDLYGQRTEQMHEEGNIQVCVVTRNIPSCACHYLSIRVSADLSPPDHV